jgi:CRISPR-associated protein Cas2
MLVIAVERAPPKVRGYLASWALQIATGVYVANLPARTRDEIWEYVVRWATRETTAVMLWNTMSNEQGLEIRIHGSPRRRVTRVEGLLMSTWIPADEEGP